MGTDRDWEAWGRDDPYFGVVSNEDFRADALTDATLAAFFKTGEDHIAWLFDRIRSRFQADFSPDTALDFGCGVGRLLIPMARRCRRATGVDVSPSMRALAHANCEKMGIGNVDLVESDDQLSKVQGEYDLINSEIVLPHIHPRRGYRIIHTLAGKIRIGGCLAVQLLYACNTPPLTRALVNLRYRFPPANALRNLLKGRPLREPAMQLHIYDLPTVLRGLSDLGFDESLLITKRFPNGEFDSVTLIARRATIR